MYAIWLNLFLPLTSTINELVSSEATNDDPVDDNESISFSDEEDPEEDDDEEDYGEPLTSTIKKERAIFLISYSPYSP